MSRPDGRGALSSMSVLEGVSAIPIMSVCAGGSECHTYYVSA